MCDDFYEHDMDKAYEKCAYTCETVDTLCHLIGDLIEKIQDLNVRYTNLNSTHCRLCEEILKNRELPDDVVLKYGMMRHAVQDVSLDELCGYDFYRYYVYAGADPMKFRRYQMNLRRARNGGFEVWI